MAKVLDIITVGSKSIYHVDSDPSSGNGTPAPIGSMALSETGSIFIKIGSSDKNWDIALTSSYLRREEVTLSSKNIEDGEFELNSIPVNSDSVELIPKNGIVQKNGVDFVVHNSKIKFKNLGLDGFLEEDEVLFVRYLSIF